jgi:acyl carrier protein
MVRSVNPKSNDKLREIIIEILTKVLNSRDSKNELVLDKSNPNWDSLKHLQISLEIEDYFGVQLSDEEAIEFFDVESILILINRVIQHEN